MEVVILVFFLFVLAKFGVSRSHCVCMDWVYMGPWFVMRESSSFIIMGLGVQGRGVMSLPQKSNPIWNTAEFKKLPLEFRVGAIISDGQWYTADKIRSLCGEREPVTVRPILDEMCRDGEVNMHENGESFCMDLQQMKAWRDRNHMPLEAQTISRIVAPRIFGSPSKRRYTENEFFAQAPLHQLGTVTFYLEDASMLDDLKREFGWMGKFKMEEGGRCKLMCLSAPVARAKIIQYDADHGGTILARSCNSYNVGLQRELCELDQDALTDIIEYYVAFAPILVPQLKKTFSTYMSNGSTGDVKAEGNSVICQWIIGSIQKYKETGPYPFSVLVQQVIPRLMYEYSSNQIGVDVNKFQVNKNRAIKMLNAENGLTDPQTYYSADTVRMKMMENGFKLSRREYRDYDAALDSWRKTTWATDLAWDDGEQKSVGEYDPNMMVDPFSNEELEAVERRSGLQQAIIHAGVDSGDYDACMRTLRVMTDSRSLSELLAGGNGLNVGDGFKRSLASCVSRYMVVDA